MIPIDVVLLFTLASLALAVAPGPDNLFVLTQSALHGPRAGWWVTLGLCTGLLFHISAVALGVAAVFQTSALAFTVLKSVGAAYLLYLAWGAWRAGRADIPTQAEPPRSARALYARGIVMNITNPKVAIFFLAFLPQFADPARGSVPLQIALLGLVFMASALLVFSLIAWMAGGLGQWLQRSPGVQRLINRLAATVFAALAVRLVWSRPGA